MGNVFKQPPFTPWQVIEAISQGKARALNKSERQAYAGAPDEAMMIADWTDNWECLVSFIDGGIAIEAYGLTTDGDVENFMLHGGGWSRA